MLIKPVNPLKPLPERRRFGRIHIAEPRVCHIHLPQSQDLWTNQGILVNISLGGIYFVCDRQPPLEKDDIRYLTFDAPHPDADSYRFGFHVLVVRAEQWHVDLPQFAVALRIISDPISHSLQEPNKREVTSLDKPRIMYQYYDLNKQAYEIITNTSDIRRDKIKNIKHFIDRGSYKIKSEKVTQSVMNNMLLENILRFNS
jgi:anti-sigma28 factor (negative regulator of flagellin synthesis)